MWKTQEGGVELKNLDQIINSFKTPYFYPGSFDLKLLQSTRQGDFASLQRGLNPLFSKNYNSYFNNC